MVYQIAYCSNAVRTLSPEVIGDILDVSHRNNTRDGVTGVLIYHDRLFFQLLEGDRGLVKTCYRRICADRLHGALSLMLQADVDERAFPEWSMGLARPEDLAEGASAAVMSLSDMSRKNAKLVQRGSVSDTLVRGILEGFRDVPRASRVLNG